MYGSFNDFFKLEFTGVTSGEALLGVNKDSVDDLVEVDEAKAVRSEDGEYRHFSDGGCLGNVCDEDEENVEIEKDTPKDGTLRLDTISNDEGKKKRLNGRRNIGPFKCLECGKVLSSKVILTHIQYQ